MNRWVEVFFFEDVSDIEYEVNKYCNHNEIIPLSISVVYSTVKERWVVSLVVEEKGGASDA